MAFVLKRSATYFISKCARSEKKNCSKAMEMVGTKKIIYMEKNITFKSVEQDEMDKETRETSIERQKRRKKEDFFFLSVVTKCGKKHSAFSSREIYFMQTPRTLNKLK